MKPLISVLAVAVFTAWACLACTPTTDDAAQHLGSAVDDECGRAADYPDQPGRRRSATHAQLLVALECRLSTMSPDFVAAFDRGSIRTFHSNAQLRAILQALETIPDRGDDVGRALTILLRAAVDAGIPEVVGPAFRPVLRDLIDDVLATHPDAFANAFDSEVLQALSVEQLASIYMAIIELPRETEHLLANIEVVHKLELSVRSKRDLMSAGYARVLRDTVVSLVNGFDSSFAGALNMDALNYLSLNQLQVLHSTILALPDNAQPTSANLGHIYEGLRSAGTSADLVTGAYTSSLADDVATAIATTHPNLQRAFQHDGLRHLSIARLRIVLETIGSLVDGGRDAQGAFASMHAALVRNGLSTGASRIGYRDLLAHQIDAVVSGMHENFRRVFDGRALSHSPVEHLELILGELQDWPPGYGEDGEAALIAVQMAGRKTGLNLDIGYSRLLAERRAPILAAIEQTLESMAPAFVGAFSTSRMTAMSPEVLQAVLRAMENLSDRGADIVGGMSRVLAAAVAAGHSSDGDDFGAATLRIRMQAELRSNVAGLDDKLRQYVVIDAVNGTAASLTELQAVLLATRALSHEDDRVDALASIHTAALEAGMSPLRANFGLASLIADVLADLFSDHVALSRTYRPQHLRDQTDAVALAVYEAVKRVGTRRLDPVPVLEAMYDAAVATGMRPDATDFGVAYAQRLARQLALPRVEVLSTSVDHSQGRSPTFSFEIRNNYLEGVKAVKFAIYAYDGFGDAFGGGCIPFPARGEILLTNHQRTRHTGQTVALSWWWRDLPCTERADRFDLRVIDVAFVDDTRWP